ncbi:MAG: hypothetical protein MdMp024_1785 [Bacteroidales bacterium]
MERKINSNLLNRLTKGGLLPLLKYVKSDKALRLEVRRQGKASIYYRRGKALEIGADNKLQVDKGYGNVPATDLAVGNPAEYFKQIKPCMDKWFQDNLHPEFDLQQDIATKNQDKNDNYLILDMEYGFTQDGITIDDRQRTAFFDLLGIERKTNKVVFFEVKKGLNALTCSAGIGSHINSFETFLNGENKTVYRKDLERDIVNIVSDKTVLGIINNYSLPANFSLNNMDIELIFVF